MRELSAIADNLVIIDQHHSGTDAALPRCHKVDEAFTQLKANRLSVNPSRFSVQL